MWLSLSMMTSSLMMFLIFLIIVAPTQSIVANTLPIPKNLPNHLSNSLLGPRKRSTSKSILRKLNASNQESFNSKASFKCPIIIVDGADDEWSK